MMIERRTFSGEEYETRSEIAADGKRYVMGYFALNSRASTKITERINGSLITYTETITPEAFKDTDFGEVLYNVEHNSTRPIARTGANLQIKVDERGLFARAEIPAEADATTEQNDLIKYINQKIIRGNSFAFRAKSDQWFKKDGEVFRNVTGIAKVVDITSTVSPVYNDTFIFTRSLDENAIKEITDVEVQIPVESDLEKNAIDFQFLKLKAIQF